ncbi:MAG: DUF5016 domain-containing protein [Paludibacter sp.]|nr:DUF5016 domain-containing protein [Paludibacter sp.]
MKNILKISLIIIAIVLFSCKDEQLRVKYPYSLPEITDATVAETEIMYGDSVSLTVGDITDNVTPLSTLEIRVVVNDVIITKESVRTKGNSASYSAKYQIPFGPYMPDNADVEVYLSAINVEGNHTDQVVSTAKVRRPEIPQLYLVPVTGGGATKLSLTDAENYIYSASNLNLANEITFYLATKVTRFGNVDWTGMVFGSVNGELAEVQQDGNGITLSDLTLIGYKEVNVDLFNYVVTGVGDPLTPATSMDITTFASVDINSTDHLNVTTADTWKTSVIYLGKDTEMTVTGVNNFSKAFTPDFFEVTGADKVKFLGETGVYTVYYLPSADYVYVEQPNAVYPDVLWLDGVGFGRPQEPLAKTSSWNWNSPLEYAFCRKVSAGVYQTTIYVEHVLDETADEPWRLRFSAKFFHQRGWGGEVDAREYTINSDLLIAPTDADLGNFNGTDNLVAAPGVYRFTIDTNAKTVNFVKVN